MADFDPFALNQKQDDAEMPIFGSFDIKNDSNDKSNQNQKTEHDDNLFPTFGDFSFQPEKKSEISNEFPNFESFDTGSKASSEEMPTFDSFEINSQSNPKTSQPPTFESNDDEINSQSNPKTSQPPTFESNDDEIFKSKVVDTTSPFHSLAQSLITANSIQQEIPDDNDTKENDSKMLNSTESNQNPLDESKENNFVKPSSQTTTQNSETNNTQKDVNDFPSFGSFAEFDSHETKETEMPEFSSFAENSSKIDSNEVKSNNENQNSIGQSDFLNFPAFGPSAIDLQNKSEVSNDNKPPQSPKKERTSLSASLHSVKSLLKPMPSSNTNKIDFSPDSIKIVIPPPKPFKDTALAKEISDYCMKTYNHPYTFT